MLFLFAKDHEPKPRPEPKENVKKGPTRLWVRGRIKALSPLGSEPVRYHEVVEAVYSELLEVSKTDDTLIVLTRREVREQVDEVQTNRWPDGPPPRYVEDVEPVEAEVSEAVARG